MKKFVLPILLFVTFPADTLEERNRCIERYKACLRLINLRLDPVIIIQKEEKCNEILMECLMNLR